MSESNARDPRVDPKPGDVVRYAVRPSTADAETVTWTRTVTGRHGRSVEFDRQSPNGAAMLCGRCECSLVNWRLAMAGAEVVTVAP